MGTSAPENGIYGISGLWDLGIMGFEICGILVLWEKGGEEGRNRERKVGQEPWSIKNRGKIDSHQARLLQSKESQWNIYYDVSIKNPHPNSLISINCVFSHK